MKKLSKRAKRRSKEEAEARIAEQENALLAAADAPQSADDYERLLVGTCSREQRWRGNPELSLLGFRRQIVLSAASPNSSYLWVKYMAFQLGLTEIDKARAVAERALKSTPSPRGALAARACD